MTTQILSTFSLDQLQDVIRECIRESQNLIIQPVTLPQGKEFITENEAKELLSVSKVTLKKWRDDGRLKFYRIGSRIRYKRTELIDALETRKNYGRQSA